LMNCASGVPVHARSNVRRAMTPERSMRGSGQDLSDGRMEFGDSERLAQEMGGAERLLIEFGRCRAGDDESRCRSSRLADLAQTGQPAHARQVDVENQQSDSLSVLLIEVQKA